MKEQDDIDHLFRSEFEDFEAVPPASVKEAIDQSIVKARTRRFSRWFYVGLSVVLILFVAGVSLLDEARNNDQLAKSHAPGNQVEGQNEAPNETEDQPAAGNENQPVSSQQPNDAQKGHATGLDTIHSSSQKAQPSGQATKTPKNSSGAKPTPVNSQKIGQQSSRKGTSKRKAQAKSTFQADPKPLYSKNKKSKSKQGKNVQNAGSTAGAGNSIGIGKQVDPTGNEQPTSGKNQQPSTGNQAQTQQPTFKERDSLQAAKQVEKTEKKDSLTPYADSTAISENPDKKKDRESTFLLSLKPGTSFGFNQRKDTSSLMELKERSAFFIQGEASWFFKPRMAVTSGLSYESRKELLSKKTTTVDSSIVSSEMEYIIDSLGNVTDSTLVPVYVLQTNTSTLQNSYKLYSIGLPVFFTYSMALSPKLNLDLSAGAVLSLQGTKIVSETFGQGELVTHKFGMKACIRGQLRYQFSAWGVSLNTNFGYDVIPASSWPGIERSRTYLDLGVGVHYVIGK